MYVCLDASLRLIRFDLPQSTEVLLLNEIFDLSNVFLIVYNILDDGMLSLCDKE